MKKILIVTGIFPPDIGGPASYVPKLSISLVRLGFDIEVITLSERLDFDGDIYPFPVKRIKRGLNLLSRWCLVIVEIVRSGQNADIIYVNGLQLEATIANFFLRKQLVIKVVGDFAWERAISRKWTQDLFDEFQYKRHGVKVTLLKKMRAWWTRRANKVIVPSTYLQRVVLRWGVPVSRVNIIYNAFENHKTILPINLDWEVSKVIVTVCRLVPWKRVDQLIECVAQLEDIGLIVVGDGPEMISLNKLSEKLELSDRVMFTGYLSKKEALAYISLGDVFVLNSTYEGLPHVILEALSLGVPVIATRVGGTPEVVCDGENGYLFDLGDETGLYDLLVDGFQNNAFGALSTEMANMEKFDYNNMLNNTTNLFQNVIKK